MTINSSALTSDPLAYLKHEHDLQVLFCDLLETIADDLPNNVNYSQASTALIAFKNLPRHHRFEEKTLFPLLRKRAKTKDNIDSILDHLAMEHAIDESLAAELTDDLRLFAQDLNPVNTDLTGYMLRGFFENYRRHINWENVVLLPLAHKRLVEKDLEMLSSVLQETRRDPQPTGFTP